MDSIYNDEIEQIKELFIGKSVKKVGDDTLELSDGTVVELRGNGGCGGCSNGYYYLTELNEVPNIITNITVSRESDEYSNGFADTIYELFVYAENRKINLASFEGSDGNGYYGTGFYINVRK